jgi:hypothetical protein
LVQVLGLLALALGLAFAEGDLTFNASEISGRVMQYLQTVVAAGVVVLGATIGISAAWRYAKRFLKG